MLYEKKIPSNFKNEGQYFNKNSPEKFKIPEKFNSRGTDTEQHIHTKSVVGEPKVSYALSKLDNHEDTGNKKAEEINQEKIQLNTELYNLYREQCVKSIDKLRFQNLNFIEKSRLYEIKHQLEHIKLDKDIAKLIETNEELKRIQESLRKLLKEEEAVAERIAELESKIQTVEAEIKKVANAYETLYESHFAGFHGNSLDFRVEKTTFNLEDHLGGKILIGCPIILEDGRCVYDIENISQNKTYRVILNEKIPAIDDDGLVVTLGSQLREVQDRENNSNIVEIEGTVNHIDHSNQTRVISLVQEREKLKEELKQLKSIN